MTNAVFAIAAIAVVAMLVVAVLRTTTNRATARGLASDGNDPANDQWLTAARSAVKVGLDLVTRLAEEPAAEAAQVRADVTAELDQLTTQLVELSATAPTAMDIRVCRNVAVRCQALSVALHHRQDSEEGPSHPSSSATLPLRDHRTDFETAIHDLDDHVNLV